MGQTSSDKMINIILAVSSKPSVGLATSIGATLLTWLHIINPIIGFVGCLFGALAAIYSYIANRKKSKELDLEIKIKQAELKKLID